MNNRRTLPLHRHLCQINIILELNPSVFFLSMQSYVTLILTNPKRYLKQHYLYKKVKRLNKFQNNENPYRLAFKHI